MIPTDMSTASVHEFIDKISKTKSQTDLDDLLDVARMQAVVDNTQWGFQQVTMASKEALIREVVLTEVCRKRKDLLAAFAEGLKVVTGLFALLC